MDSMKVYGKRTKKMIRDLQDKVLKVERSGGRVHVSGGKVDYTLPTKSDFAAETFLSEKAEGESNKDIARKVGYSESGLSKVLSDRFPNNASKESILCALLSREEIPELREVNHKLTQHRRSILYTQTVSKNENCRNFLLISTIEYARKAPCPPDGWVAFADCLINYFNRRLGGELNIMMPLLREERGGVRAEGEGGRFQQYVRAQETPLENWEEQMRKIALCEPPTFRKEMLRRYQKAHEFDSESQAMNELSRILYVDETYIRSLLSKRGKPGRREVLIKCGKAMGCDWEEINWMLREVDAELIYPNSSDSKDVELLETLFGASSKSGEKETQDKE